MSERQVESAGDERTEMGAVRHSYRTLSDREKALMGELKDRGDDFLKAIAGAQLQLGRNGREFSLAKTKVEEAVMWAVKGLTA